MPRGKEKSKNYKTYRNSFERMVKRGVPVRGFKYDEYVEELVNFEDYKQCYNPEFRPRKELPKYWFVSKEGFLINAKGNNLTFVKPILNKDRPCFDISRNPKNKSISTYALVGLAWESYIEPDAYTFMQMNGIDCIGSNPKEDENGKIKGKVQAHHTAPEGYLKETTLENYILNNRPEYIEFLTNKDHDLIGHFTGNTKKDMKRILKNEYKYDDVPQEHIKVFAYKEIDTKTGQETKIAKVLTQEEANRMQYIPIEGYMLSDGNIKKARGFKVEAKEKKDIEAYNMLSQDEKTQLKRYIQLLFKHNKTFIEIEFHYNTISMKATKIF